MVVGFEFCGILHHVQELRNAGALGLAEVNVSPEGGAAILAEVFVGL